MLESKRRATIFILISFLLAALAGFLFYRQVQALNNQLGGMTEIYVAAKDIASRSLITADQVKTVKIPNKFVTSSHVTDPARLQNQVFVVPLKKDELITANILRPVSGTQNENSRLITLYSSQKVRFDEVLEAQDRVDLIVSQNVDGKAKTDVFMKDVLVASVLPETNGRFTGVMVEVTDKDAPRLVHMENYADQIRILKASAGRAAKPDTSPKPDTTPKPGTSTDKPAVGSSGAPTAPPAQGSAPAASGNPQASGDGAAQTQPATPAPPAQPAQP